MSLKQEGKEGGEFLVAYSEEGTPLIGMGVEPNSVSVRSEGVLFRVEWPEIRSGEAYRVNAEKDRRRVGIFGKEHVRE